MLIINIDIKYLLSENDRNQIEDYTCKVCFEVMKVNQEWYQCVEGHAACKDCWIKILNSNSKSCMECRKPIVSLNNGLSRCRVFENSFKNKIISCPFTYKVNSLLRSNILDEADLILDDNGCKELIKVSQLDQHQKNCNFRLVKCDSNGCDNNSRFNENHDSQCPNKNILCDDCKLPIIRKNLLGHRKHQCQLVKIKCDQCSLEVIKKELDDHKCLKCTDTLVSCKLAAYGCSGQIKRSEVTTHLEQVSHTLSMIKLIDKQSMQIKELERMNIQHLKNIEAINLKLKELEDSSNNRYLYSLKNAWVISNFLKRIKYLQNKKEVVYMYSPEFDIGNFSFKLLFGVEGEDLYFYLELIEFDGYSCVPVVYTLEVLNSKDPNKNLQFKVDHQYTRESCDIGKTFGSHTKFTKENGYISENNYLKIDFTVHLKKVALHS